MEKKLNRFVTIDQGTKHVNYVRLYDIYEEEASSELLKVGDIGVMEQEDWYGYVYITAIPGSGKAYIGKHKGKADTSYTGSGRILKKAVDKYGKENVYTFVIDTVECKNKTEKELASELHELESQWIKHELGIDIESSSVSEFYNLKTAFTKVNMEKQVEDYEERLNKIEKIRGNNEFVKLYRKLNLLFNKKEIMMMIMEYDNLDLNIKEISDFNIEELTSEDRLTIIGEYYTELPCLYNTMYNTFITEIKLLPIDLKLEFIDEDRYEPFNKYISKYLMYSSATKDTLLKAISDSVNSFSNMLPQQMPDTKKVSFVNNLSVLKENKFNKWL